jgi:hypothetical protein
MSQNNSYIKPKKISIKARLRQPNYANFLEYYHNNEVTNDYFYNYLTKLANSHKQLTNQDTKFKSNFTNEGFYFKTKEGLKCKNAIKKPCLINDLLDTDVTLKLKITPYNFLDTNNLQLIGIAIQVTEINTSI